ncbi:glutaredoxin family protein [Cellvibrio japonicus]|nr:glutaredoxin family protein [Cellvibrio japonicus]QEI12386.1 glutaredoxin family protein [Cellvibrio japonicus]QEI15959.1 glutaredoxin family protein [Cellvibrio japonicus]QEI19538.1 glutaredoxin family protein [Cellvibrio japonicus]
MKKYLFLLVALGVFLNWHKIRDEFAPPPDFSAAHEEGVVLYATTWCGYCAKTREFFKKHNIAYVEYDIEKSTEGRAQYDQLRGSGIPLVMIDGEVLRGYNPSKMKQLLNIQ